MQKVLQLLLDDIREFEKNSFETRSDSVTHIFHKMLSMVEAVNLVVQALAECYCNF